MKFWQWASDRFSRGVAGGRWLYLAAAVILISQATVRAETYVPPANNRADIPLTSGWRFIRQDVAGAQQKDFDDSTWAPVNLPHTWNNLDGEEGGTNYYRRPGWYRLHYRLDGRYEGRRLFLKFDGAFSVADVYVNGRLLGEHRGGFAAFVFDATPYLAPNGENVIAVKVNNAFNKDIPPYSADFTFEGGLYRPAHLLVTDPVQISPLDYGSPGVYLRPTNVSSNAADLQVTTVVSNSTAGAEKVTVRTVIVDANTNVVAVLNKDARVAGASSLNVVMSATIRNPHLWDGLSDPYLHRAFVELHLGNSVVDLVSQPLGFRWCRVDPNQGFFLNGRHYDLHGVSMHQDWLDRGWAIGDAERRANFALLKEIGATALRLSHYEHAEQTYDLADENGIVLWSEIPVINRITESHAFYANAEQQMRELIRQRYNHPSVVCWGVFNEITLRPGPVATNLVSKLVRLEAEEDPTRPSTAAANSRDDDPTTRHTEWLGFNKYFGWYNGRSEDLGAWADKYHATYPNRPIGITEYGAGASIRQHSENPTQPEPTGKFHPEEYQDLLHEIQWQEMKARPFLWCKFVWNLCDFASAGRDEGDTPGRNDKGLVTYDRQVRKDAFYWYKANWSAEPTVYITGHTFTNRPTNWVTTKVYANCDSVELFVNGASQGARTSTNCIFTWPVLLNGGGNTVKAVGTKGGTTVADSLSWIAPAQGAAKVEVRKMDAGYQLYVNGQPFWIKGAGLGSGSMEELAARGANSFRTWSTGDGEALLAEAAKNGLCVTMGLSVGRERDGFNYDDPAAVARQLDQIKQEVLRYKDSPALIIWAIGNELNLNATNPKVWDAVNGISKMIHQVDPNHLTTSPLAGVNRELLQQLRTRAPDLDLLAVQMYADIVNLPKYLREAQWNGPYIVTEWGATGHWECGKTEWGAPIENDSTVKAHLYETRYEAVIIANTRQCLGSYAFLWGNKQERTPTWYGVFLDSGERTESVDVLQHLWTGQWPAKRSPQIQGAWLNGQTAVQNVRLSAGKTYTAKVMASDPENAPLVYSWNVLEESSATSVGGDFEARPKAVAGVIQDPSAGQITITAPERPGAYRLFAYVRDGKGHAAHVNIPFYVDGADGLPVKSASLKQ